MTLAERLREIARRLRMATSLDGEFQATTIEAGISADDLDALAEYADGRVLTRHKRKGSRSDCPSVTIEPILVFAPPDKLEERLQEVIDQRDGRVLPE